MWQEKLSKKGTEKEDPKEGNKTHTINRGAAMNKKEDTHSQEGGEDVEEEEESREEIIAQLKATKQLDVSRQELTVKKLPPELGLMVNLEMLSMSNNELTDLPKSFGRFSWFPLKHICFTLLSLCSFLSSCTFFKQILILPLSFRPLGKIDGVGIKQQPFRAPSQTVGSSPASGAIGSAQQPAGRSGSRDHQAHDLPHQADATQQPHRFHSGGGGPAAKAEAHQHPEQPPHQASILSQRRRVPRGAGRAG